MVLLRMGMVIMDFLACSTRLANGFGHFVGLTQARTHAPGAVAYHHNGAEAKAASALTTLATRLMLTTLSVNWSVASDSNKLFSFYRKL